MEKLFKFASIFYNKVVLAAPVQLHLPGTSSPHTTPVQLHLPGTSTPHGAPVPHEVVAPHVAPEAVKPHAPSVPELNISQKPEVTTTKVKPSAARDMRINELATKLEEFQNERTGKIHEPLEFIKDIPYDELTEAKTKLKEKFYAQKASRTYKQIKETSSGMKAATKRYYSNIMSDINFMINNPKNSPAVRKALGTAVGFGVLYYLITGKSPKASTEQGQEIVKSLQKSNPKPLSEALSAGYGPGISGKIAAVTSQIKSFDPKDPSDKESLQDFKSTIEKIANSIRIVNSIDLAVDDAGSTKNFVNATRNAEQSAKLFLGQLDQVLEVYAKNGKSTNSIIELQTSIGEFLLEIEEARSISHE